MSMEREEHMKLQAALYVEGQMEDDERERFEARMAESSSLRAEVEVLRRADESLRRTFGGTSALDLGADADAGPAGRIDRGGTDHRRSSWRVRAWWLAGAVAAAAVIVLAGLPIMMRSPARPAPAVGARMSAEGVYALEASRGWAIEHVCGTNREFAAYSHEKMGAALIADASRVAGVEIVGWTGYDIDLRGAGLDGRACLIVARVEGAPVLVLLDPGGERNRLAAEGAGGLRVFRREVGSVSVYEVTPLEEARVVGVFEEAPLGLLEGEEG